VVTMNNSDFDYLLNTVGVDVTINNNSASVLIFNTSVNEFFDDKKIFSQSPLKRGDLVNFQDNDYLVISEVNGSRRGNYYAGLLRNTNYRVKFNYNGFIKSFPAILTNQALGLETNRFSVTLPDGTILIYMQENDDTLAISINQRFIKNGCAYKIVGINRSMKGLIILTCEVDTFQVNDNREKEIVDDTYTFNITFINGNSASITVGNTLQLTSELRCNGSLVENPGFVYTYSSSNPDVAEVDENGLITAISEGVATITLTLSADDNDSISTSIEITVESAVVPDNYTINIIGADQIAYGQTETFTAVVKNNGVVVNEPVIWSLVNETGQGNIIDYDDASCTVKNNSAGIIVLKAVLSSDSTVEATKVIICKGLW